ncbi:hypothetical protein ACTMU2_12550 [Cupriavidus basilensis]
MAMSVARAGCWRRHRAAGGKPPGAHRTGHRRAARRPVLPAINTHLAPAEAAYVLKDCGARLLVVSPAMLPLVEAVRAADAHARTLALFVLAGAGQLAEGFGNYEEAIAAFSTDATLPQRPLGRDMLYSSGTTGPPQGHPPPARPV